MKASKRMVNQNSNLGFAANTPTDRRRGDLRVLQPSFERTQTHRNDLASVLKYRVICSGIEASLWMVTVGHTGGCCTFPDLVVFPTAFGNSRRNSPRLHLPDSAWSPDR